MLTMFSLGGLLSSIPYVLATVGLLFAYNGLIDNPMVRREARAGYVQEATVTALTAQNAELRRQADESDQLAAAWQKSLERFQEVSQENADNQEDKIAAYIADPANAGECGDLTDSDIEFLR